MNVSAGRPRLSPNGQKMKTRAVRMTDDEWGKCLSLGGSVWIRDRIAAARDGTTVDQRQAERRVKVVYWLEVDRRRNEERRSQ